MEYELIQGDCLDVLRGFADESVQCCVTSPPYWGLRDYGVAGQIGLETMDEYVERLVDVFREVRRVLRGDGTLWMNLGDSYSGRPNGNAGPVYDTFPPHVVSRRKNSERRKQGLQPGLKPKDLIGIPWRVAFALQADGWYLRQDIIWHKSNPMPESVKDRCTKAHEYMFLLSKSERYYYDAEAIREPSVGGHSKRGSSFMRSNSKRGQPISPGQCYGTHREDRNDISYNGPFRNRRSVWTLPTKPFVEAHFATFPPNLVTPCILAGSRQGDIVLDPFTGSGTTGLVALGYSRRFIGCELNPEYIEIAKRRIAPALKQMMLAL